MNVKPFLIRTSIFAMMAANSLLASAGPGPWAEGAYYPSQLDGRYFGNVYNNVDGSFSSKQTSTTNTIFITNQQTTTVISNIGGLPVTNIVTTNVVTSGLQTNNTFQTKGSVVSGVMGFAIRGGAPAVSGGGSSAAGGSAAGGSAAGGSAAGGSAALTAGGSGSSGAVDNITPDSSINYFAVYVNGSVFVGKTAVGINLDSKRVSGALINGVGDLTYQRVTNSTSSSGFLGVPGSTNAVLGVPSSTAGGYFNAKIKNNKSPFIFKGTGQITVSSTNLIDALGTHFFNTDGIKSSGLTSSGYAQ